MQVSTLLLTYNEAENLVRCLEALSWCDDVVAVDSGSTDGSQEILQKYGARVLFRTFDNFANQRNFGLDHGSLKHDWVLHLDADETTPIEFQNALNELAENSDDVDGFYVPSKMMLAGRWLKHAHGYPIYQARLGQRDRFRFIQVGHGQRERPDARMATFSEPYVHYNYSHGLRRYLERHLRYAADEAELVVSNVPSFIEGEARAHSKLAFRRALKKIFNKAPLFLRPPLRFCQILFLNQGFRDGTPGLVYAVLVAVYEGMIAALAYERLLADKIARYDKGSNTTSRKNS